MNKLQRVCIGLMLAGLPQVVVAQLQVDAFEPLENDLTANTRGTLRYDQNGEVAALIKIVTPMTGFSFGAGSLGIVATEQHEGEVWLYVPRHSQRLTITHRHFGELRNWVYPFTVEGGRTYRMLLNVGGGRFVNITTTGAATAELSIDGVSVGETPVYNRFMPCGRYVLAGTHQRFEGSDTLEVVPGDGPQYFSLLLRDQTPHFGDVEVTATDADIYFQGAHVGTGRWRTQLKEGRYEVVTKKADCTDASTMFTVEPQTLNQVHATAPVPFTGTVRLFVRPRNTVVTFDNNQTFDVSETKAMTVGTHQFSFARKGYVTDNRDILVQRSTLTADTITLIPINYLKEQWAFYFGAGYTLSSLSGLTGYVGGVWQRWDLQLSFTLGMNSSKDVFAYQDVTDGKELLGCNTYKMNAVGARLGYQFRLIPRVGITPQVGYLCQMLTASAKDGSSKFADGAQAQCLTLGAKILAVPAHRIYLFLTPEYAIPLSKDDTFDRVSTATDFSAGGLSVSVGVLFNIGK